jgi:cytochrome c
LELKIILAGIVCGAFVATPVFADEALAKKHNCTSCHAIDKKLIGPAYKDVAAKYKGQNVAAKLEEKVKMGGSGVWGPIPMPPNAAVPDADIKKLVDWVLKL